MSKENYMKENDWKQNLVSAIQEQDVDLIKKIIKEYKFENFEWRQWLIYLFGLAFKTRSFQLNLNIYNHFF